MQKNKKEAGGYNYRSEDNEIFLMLPQKRFDDFSISDISLMALCFIM